MSPTAILTREFSCSSFKNGDQVEDIVTGFKGVVTARTDHLTGCNRYNIQPRAGEDGKLPDAYWIDEPTLRIDKTRPRIVIEQIQAGEPPG